MSKLKAETHAARSLGPPAWRYKCRACHNVFKMPAASGPAEEKNRACPACHSRNIEIVSLVKTRACPPGG
jgi:Zn finger protein HypA/HybF involved in hydrogenase expression